MLAPTCPAPAICESIVFFAIFFSFCFGFKLLFLNSSRRIFEIHGYRYPFKIVTESSISAGTRRIEAVAGRAAVQWYELRSSSVAKLSRVLSCAPDSVLSRVESLLENGRVADARTSQLEVIAATARLSQRPRHSWSSDGNKLVFILAHAEDAELLGNRALKTAVEAIRDREKANVVMLLPGGVVMVSAIEKFSANELLASVLQSEAAPASSKRSGSPPFAQGKIKDSAWCKLLCDRPDTLALKLKFISK